jgi:fermentation-respiration switch protein FrsA (DUF1100 family)
MWTALVLFAVGVILLWTGQRRLMYFPLGDVGSPAAAGLPRAIPVTFATDDGLTLHGWWVPPAARATGHTVLIFNGNAGNRSFRAPLADRLARHGIASLLMDYRGYGENPGAPSEDGLARDARAAREYLAGRPDVDVTRLVYFGESLGTGVAVRLASEHPPFALVLRSPFTSLADVGRQHYPWLPVRWMLRDRFDSLDRIGLVKCPVLVIAGDRDRIIPVALSDRLYEAAPSPKRMVTIEGADHNDEALSEGPRVIASITAFLAEQR